MKTKIILYMIGGFVLFFAVMFIFGIIDVEFKKFFKPKYENVERKVFEETKSYVHGVVQDLGKYYEEYQKADVSGKKLIQNVIKVRFPEFDIENIKSTQLRNWFVEIRGY